MHPSTDLFPVWIPAALFCGLACWTQPATGQGTGLDRPHFGLGYVANAPNMMAGGGGYVVTSLLGGIGFYLDAKFDVEDPTGDDAFEEDLTADDVVNQISGATFIQRESSYRSFNAAVLRPVTPFLILYAGGGLAQRTRYHLYQANSTELGVSGVFWVTAPAEDRNQVNLMLGAFMRLGSFLSTQVGYETEPRGFSVGVSFRPPRG